MTHHLALDVTLIVGALTAVAMSLLGVYTAKKSSGPKPEARATRRAD